MSNVNVSAWIIGRRSVYVEGIIAALVQSTFNITNVFASFDKNEDDRLCTEEQILCVIAVEKPSVDMGHVELAAKRVRERCPNALIVLVSSSATQSSATRSHELLLTERDILNIDACIMGDLTGKELVFLLEMMLMNGISSELLVKCRDRSLLTLLKPAMTNGDSGITIKDRLDIDRASVTPFDRAGTRQSFSVRERQVLQGLADGDTNKTLARKMDISEATVKAHVRTVFRKLGAHNRTQAVRYYFGQQAGHSVTAKP